MKRAKFDTSPNPMTPSPSLGRSSEDLRSEAHSFRRSSPEVPVRGGEGNVAAPLVTHSDALPAGHGIFTKAELAKHLKVSIRTITEMMKRGELAYIKINGRLVRFRLEDVHARLTETCLVCNAPEGCLRTATAADAAKEAA